MRPKHIRFVKKFENILSSSISQNFPQTILRSFDLLDVIPAFFGVTRAKQSKMLLVFLYDMMKAILKHVVLACLCFEKRWDAARFSSYLFKLDKLCKICGLEQGNMLCAFSKTLQKFSSCINCAEFGDWNAEQVARVNLYSSNVIHFGFSDVDGSQFLVWCSEVVFRAENTRLVCVTSWPLC